MASNDSSDELEVPSRRRFLKVLAASAALPTILPAALEACGSAGVTGDVAAGKVADLQVDTLEALKGEGVCIGRDARGVYAMTLTCTHAGCDMSVDGSVSISGIRCGCHGSMFDATGNAVRGPAIRSLRHFAVSVDAQQNLTIHAGTDVSATTRTAV